MSSLLNPSSVLDLWHSAKFGRSSQFRISIVLEPFYYPNCHLTDVMKMIKVLQTSNTIAAITLSVAKVVKQN